MPRRLIGKPSSKPRTPIQSPTRRAPHIKLKQNGRALTPPQHGRLVGNVKFKALFMAMLPLGACGTLPLPMLRPAPQVVVQPLVIPSACRVDPVQPAATDPPALPDLPAASAPTYLALRTQRAELAGKFFEGQRDAIRNAFDTNAQAQEVCATWARSQNTEHH